MNEGDVNSGKIDSGAMDGADDRPIHVPVMQREVVEWIRPEGAFNRVVDATVGAGGHATLVLQVMEQAGQLLGVDRDPEILPIARRRLAQFGNRVGLVHGNYDELGGILKQHGWESVDAVLLDAGVSSLQLDRPERGFGFDSGPLDARMDQSSGRPASWMVNRLTADELADIFYRYGDERHSRRIARAVVEARKRDPIETTQQFSELVVQALPAAAKRGRWRIHPATRCLQALRIATNDELTHLEEALLELPAYVRAGGRVVVISFHSGEDRIAKQALTKRREFWMPLLKKPLQPSDEEIAANPRSRSAKLRCVERK